VAPLFGPSIVWYLFLGGAGSGAFVIASVAGLLGAARGTGAGQAAMGRRMAATTPEARLINTGQILGFFIVQLGVVFLIADLGRVDRAYTLFTNPTFSMASIGAWVILLFSLAAAYPMAIRHLGLPEISPALTRAVEWAGAVLGAGVMTYTGLLLQSLWVVSFWASPLVPVLFVLSSLSSGAAVLLVCGFVLGPDKAMVPLLRRVSRADAIVAALEVLALVAFLLVMRASSAGSTSTDLLLTGLYTEWFWAGYVVCGLLAPVLVQTFAHRRVQARVFGALGVLLLVGGFSLRYCIVNAGFHDAFIVAIGL